MPNSGRVRDKILTGVIPLVLLLGAPALAAPASELSPELAAVVEDARGRGLPTDDLQLKIREGLAKGVPEDRIRAVLSADVAGLEAARMALPDLDASALPAAARAMRSGVSTAALGRLGHALPRSFDTLADLTRVGVPEPDATQLVLSASAAGDPELALHGLATAASTMLRSGASSAEVTRRLQAALASGQSPLTVLPVLPSVVPDDGVPGQGKTKAKGKAVGLGGGNAGGNGNGNGNGNGGKQ